MGHPGDEEMTVEMRDQPEKMSEGAGNREHHMIFQPIPFIPVEGRKFVSRKIVLLN